MPTDREVAWAAGLFEGEGTITLNGVAKSPRLKLSMVDADVVRRFHAIVGVGHTCPWDDKNPAHQIQLCWYTGAKADIARVLDMLIPYFGERRLVRAAHVLARAIDTPYEGWDGLRNGELEAL